MADNILTPASGATVATDDIAGVHYPRTKLTLGADGVNDGDVSAANPMPVTMAGLHAEDALHVSGDLGMALLGIRSDSDVPTAGDGDYTLLKLDEEGRLKVASKPATYSATVGNITANGQTVVVNCQRFSNLMLHCAGTFSTVNVTFEGSLNSTNGTDGQWFVVQAIRSNANTIETATGNLSAAPVYAWELSVNALKYFRVRATAFTSGTQTWTMIPGTYATEPIPGAQVSGTQPVSGTVTVNGTITANQGSTITPNASIINSAATTNGTVVKASAGTLWGGVVSNTGAAVVFVKLHNSATVTAGTTAVALTIPIAPNSIQTINFGPLGMRFVTGICLSITNLAADNDTTAVALGQVKVNLAHT